MDWSLEETNLSLQFGEEEIPLSPLPPNQSFSEEQHDAVVEACKKVCDKLEERLSTLQDTQPEPRSSPFSFGQIRFTSEVSSNIEYNDGGLPGRYPRRGEASNFFEVQLEVKSPRPPFSPYLSVCEEALKQNSGLLGIVPESVRKLEAMTMASFTFTLECGVAVRLSLVPQQGSFAPKGNYLRSRRVHQGRIFRHRRNVRRDGVDHGRASSASTGHQA